MTAKPERRNLRQPRAAAGDPTTAAAATAAATAAAAAAAAGRGATGEGAGTTAADAATAARRPLPPPTGPTAAVDGAPGRVPTTASGWDGRYGRSRDGDGGGVGTATGGGNSHGHLGACGVVHTRGSGDGAAADAAAMDDDGSSGSGDDYCDAVACPEPPATAAAAATRDGDTMDATAPSLSVQPPAGGGPGAIGGAGAGGGGHGGWPYPTPRVPGSPSLACGGVSGASRAETAAEPITPLFDSRGVVAATAGSDSAATAATAAAAAAMAAVVSEGGRAASGVVAAGRAAHQPSQPPASATSPGGVSGGSGSGALVVATGVSPPSPFTAAAAVTAAAEAAVASTSGASVRLPVSPPIGKRNRGIVASLRNRYRDAVHSMFAPAPVVLNEVRLISIETPSSRQPASAHEPPAGAAAAAAAAVAATAASAAAAAEAAAEAVAASGGEDEDEDAGEDDDEDDEDENEAAAVRSDPAAARGGVPGGVATDASAAAEGESESDEAAAAMSAVVVANGWTDWRASCPAPASDVSSEERRPRQGGGTAAAPAPLTVSAPSGGVDTRGTGAVAAGMTAASHLHDPATAAGTGKGGGGGPAVRSAVGHHASSVVFPPGSPARSTVSAAALAGGAPPPPAGTAVPPRRAHLTVPEMAVIAREVQLRIGLLFDRIVTPSRRAVRYELADTSLLAPYVAAVVRLRVVDASTLPPPERTAFFINLYNALVVHSVVAFGFLRPVPSSSTLAARLALFKTAAYNVGGRVYTLDEMEHGVLRGNRAGPVPFAPRPFADDEARRQVALVDVDPRVHFALNCGARSCPAIRLYSAAGLDAELDAAARAFLRATTTVDAGGREVELSKILSWYAPDFGATLPDVVLWVAPYLEPDDGAAVVRLVEDHLGGVGRLKVTYADYDWSLNAANGA